MVYKAASKKTMATAYNVTVPTFNKWMKPFENQIGDYLSRCYTPKQVEKIVSLIGLPEYAELITK